MTGAKRQFTIVDSHMPEMDPGSSRTTKGTSGTPNFIGGRVAPLNTVSITAQPMKTAAIAAAAPAMAPPNSRLDTSRKLAPANMIL